MLTPLAVQWGWPVVGYDCSAGSALAGQRGSSQRQGPIQLHTPRLCRLQQELFPGCLLCWYVHLCVCVRVCMRAGLSPKSNIFQLMGWVCMHSSLCVCRRVCKFACVCMCVCVCVCVCVTMAVCLWEGVCLFVCIHVCVSRFHLRSFFWYYGQYLGTMCVCACYCVHVYIIGWQGGSIRRA